MEKSSVGETRRSNILIILFYHKKKVSTGSTVQVVLPLLAAKQEHRWSAPQRTKSTLNIENGF